MAVNRYNVDSDRKPPNKEHKMSLRPEPQDGFDYDEAVNYFEQVDDRKTDEFYDEEASYDDNWDDDDGSMDYEDDVESDFDPLYDDNGPDGD